MAKIISVDIIVLLLGGKRCVNSKLKIVIMFFKHYIMIILRLFIIPKIFLLSKYKILIILPNEVHWMNIMHFCKIVIVSMSNSNLGGDIFIKVIVETILI